MAYFGTLFLMLTMMLMISIVGRRICDFASFRLGPVYRFYFSPLFGLAFFILIFTVHGWLAPFKTGSSIAIVAALVLVALYFEKNRENLPRYLLAICLFSLLASSPVLFPLFRFDAYNSFNDTFTYLVHGQWLQTHSFSDRAIASGHHPALTQVVQYQSAGHRMGASFLLGWAQSLFGVEWSYYVYPAVVSLPLVAGALAVGGAVKIIVRRQRLISMLAATGTATMFNGFAFGAVYGFFPQTFGLAFAVGGTTLLGAILTEGLRQREFRTIILNSIPGALVFSVFILTYNDMLPFVAAGAAFSVAFLLTKSDQKTRILKILLVLLAGIALLVNFELVRVIKNFVGTLLNVKSIAIGWPVLWSPMEFLAHAFGFKSPIGDLWIFKFKNATLLIVTLVVLAVLYFVAIKGLRAKKPSIYVVLHFSVVLAMAVGFLYFRYLGAGPTPEEVGFGHTFLEFKLAKWVSPFCFVLMGATFSYFHGKCKGHYSKLMPAFLIGLIALSTAGNHKSAEFITNNFLDETGYRRSAFSSLVHLRELTKHLDPKEIIYLNLGAEHHKLRQMITYILYDKKLAADYSDDGYILGNLPPGQRNIPFQTAGWVIDYANAKDAKSMSGPTAGNLILKKRPDYLVKLISVTEGYARETDDSNWWHWTANSLLYSYRILGKLESVRLKFRYMPAVEGKEIKIIVRAKNSNELSLKMKKGWNEFISPPIEVGGSNEISIKFTSDDKPVRISDGDPRLMSFLIQNLELVPAEGVAVQKLPLPKTKTDLIGVSGGYTRETEGGDWWYWTADRLVFDYVLTPSDAGKRKQLKLKFTYMPASVGRNIKIIIKSGNSTVTLPLALKVGWNEFISAPIVIDGPDITISFVSDKKPVYISQADSRLLSFLIKNLELVEVENLPEGL